MPLQTTVLLIKSLISRPPLYRRFRSAVAQRFRGTVEFTVWRTVGLPPGATHQGLRAAATTCAAKRAKENPKADQFPGQQLQARFQVMFKEHLDGHIQRLHIYQNKRSGCN